jgi:hypothetical protein
MFKKFLIVASLVLVVVLMLVGCSTTYTPPPMPTYNVDELYNKITDLQAQLNEAKLVADEQHLTDTEKIDKLTGKINEYQSQIDKQTKLDNMDWVYPAKIEYKGYRAGVVCLYTIKVHNGSDESKTYKMQTEQVVSDDVTFAKVPKNISDWVSYDGFNEFIFSLDGKMSKDISVQFLMPIEERFYSVTKLSDIGLDNNTMANLSQTQRDIMVRFIKDRTVTKSAIENNLWQDDVKLLVDKGLVMPDKKYQFMAVCGENKPQGNIVTRNAIKWVVTMSEFSK